MPNCNPGLGESLQHPAWIWSRSILKGKDKGAVNKKGKYSQEKKASNKGTNTQNVYIVLKSTVFLGCIRVEEHVTS